MKQFNIPIEKVVTHKHWSGKNCPRKLLPRWSEFIGMVQNACGGVITHKVTIPNTAFWQAQSLVIEFERIQMLWSSW